MFDSSDYSNLNGNKKFSGNILGRACRKGASLESSDVLPIWHSSKRSWPEDVIKKGVTVMENLAFVARTSYDTHQNTDRTNDASNCANEWLAADSCQALPDSAFIRNQNCRQTYETALRIRMQERGKILDTICCLAKESVLTEQICQVLMVAYSRPVGC